MFVLVSSGSDIVYLYGNKTTTDNFKYARKFASRIEAENHKKTWGLEKLEVSAVESVGKMATNESVVWTYIARIRNPDPDYPIGTIVCVAVDNPDRIKENAQQIEEWLREGMIVERVPRTWVHRCFGTTEQYVGE